MRKTLKLLVILTIIGVVTSGCGKAIWPGDAHFDENGECLDSLKTFMVMSDPSALKFYVEVSGSMNGFFRSNKVTEFKKDVWSIVSNFGAPGVTVLSNAGTLASHFSADEFKTRMNTGRFESTASTRVPTMIKSILSDLDYNNGECAVLISDMKYDPVGIDAPHVLVGQYKTDIRNTIDAFPGVGICLICATSEYLDKQGSVVCADSPYYYLILGKDEKVALMRNRIATLLDDNHNYLDSIETGFDYKAPAYTFGMPDNLIQLGMEYGNPTFTTFTNFDQSYSNTCTVNLTIDMSSFRWLEVDENTIRDNFKVNAVYGSNIIVDNIKLDVSNHYNKELDRRAYATIDLKVSDIVLGYDEIEWYLDHPDKTTTQRWSDICKADNPNDYSGSFSLDSFIEGIFDAEQNKWDIEPNRILITDYK